MSIYYENGCFSLWNADALDSLPKMTVRKITKMINNNLYRAENEECIESFCEWLCAKIDFFKRKFAADRKDTDAAKQLKFYLSLSDAL